LDTGMNCQTSQGIHNFGDIDVVRASNTTGIAGSTDPDGFGRENPFTMVILNMPEDLIRKDIHGISDRTPCGTLLTLIAGLYLFTTGLNDFRKE